MPQQYLDLFESYLAEESFAGPAPDLYDPVQYILSLGGKRIRPLAVMMGCGLFQDDVKPALPAALAVEMFHNFTLMHDDIMDAAPLRRGKETVHIKYNTNAAILSGDAMFALSYRVLGRLPDSVLPKAMKLFTETAIGVCEGQQMDMAFETRDNVSIDEYIEMIRLKTAILPACCFELGAFCGGANEQDAKQLYEFGLQIGIAFQIKDDFLDTFGDAEQVGKKAGGDIVQNKKTYLYLSAIANASESQRSQLLDWYNADKQHEEGRKIDAVIKLFNELKVPEVTTVAIADWTNKAMTSINGLSIDNSRKETLRQFADGLMNRKL
jgi:geranylgeranyl diphosphate synthase type II